MFNNINIWPFKKKVIERKPYDFKQHGKCPDTCPFFDAPHADIKEIAKSYYTCSEVGNGIVRPARCAFFNEQLATDFLYVVDPDTGAPVVLEYHCYAHRTCERVIKIGECGKWYRFGE